MQTPDGISLVAWHQYYLIPQFLQPREESLIKLVLPLHADSLITRYQATKERSSLKQQSIGTSCQMHQLELRAQDRYSTTSHTPSIYQLYSPVASSLLLFSKVYHHSKHTRQTELAHKQSPSQKGQSSLARTRIVLVRCPPDPIVGYRRTREKTVRL